MIYLHALKDGVDVEIAMQWSDSYNESIFPYTNNVFNRDGGTHMTGLRTALTRVINQYGSREKLLKDLKNPLSGEDVREGLTAILSVKHPDPSFSSQTKDKLVSSEVKGIVESVLSEKLNEYLEEEPKAASASSRRPSWPPEPAKPPAVPARWCSARASSTRARCPASWPTAKARIPARARSTSSRVTRRAAARSRAATAVSKRSCRCAERSSTSSARVSRR